MSLQTAKTITSGTSSPAIKNRYYDKLFLRIAESKLVHQQLGQLNRQVEKGEGGFGTGVVYWTKWSNLPLVTAGQGEGYPTTAIQMTAVNVTGSTAQYDAAVSISDLMAYTAMGDVMKAAVERLAYNAGLSIDTVVRNAVALNGTRQNAGGTATAGTTAIPQTAVMSIAEIRKAVRTLHGADAPTLSDGYYVAPIHPDALYDLFSDSSTGGWIDANKYTEGNADKLFKGEVGKLHGVRFLQSSNAGKGLTALANSGVVASGALYATPVFGQDAFGVTKLQSLQTFVKGFGSAGAGDPTDKIATAGWKTTFGTTVLNNSFYVSIVHPVSS